MRGKLVGICRNIFVRFFARLAIAQTKAIVAKRESQIDFGVLGRSLSCNPLLPRGFAELYKCAKFNSANQSSAVLNAQIINNTRDLDKISDLANLAKVALIIDTTLKSDIALVAEARHYTPFLVIHKDIFISRYQILESLVYGADCVMLSRHILGNESLEMLQSYANHLGLCVAILDSNNRISISNPANDANLTIKIR